jgi:hypothetical protein
VVSADSPKGGILAAALGLGIAVLIGALLFLERMEFDDYVIELLRHATGMTRIWAPAVAFLLLLAVVGPLSLIGGLMIYHSTPDRSYIGHFWHGAVLSLCCIVLYFTASVIMYVSPRWG